MLLGFSHVGLSIFHGHGNKHVIMTWSYVHFVDSLPVTASFTPAHHICHAQILSSYSEVQHSRLVAQGFKTQLRSSDEAIDLESEDGHSSEVCIPIRGQESPPHMLQKKKILESHPDPGAARGG